LARKFIELADAVTCPTIQMAERIFSETGVVATVIGDPCEFPERPPKEQDELNVMWFGFPTNLDTLEIKKYNFNIEIVTKTKAAKIRNITLTPWSIKNMEKAFSRNNVVIIPSNNHGSKHVKSPNRLVESLRSGLYVVAAPLPSYREFGDFVELTWDTIEGLGKRRDTEKIRRGQEYIREHYSPEVIGDKWDRIFIQTRYA